MKTLTCPALVKFLLVFWSALTVVIVGFTALICGESLVGTVIAFIALTTVFFLIFVLPYVRVFVVVKMTKEGVSNGFCEMRWSEIHSASLSFPNIVIKPNIPVKKAGMMICLQNDENAHTKNFLSEECDGITLRPFTYPIKECIFLPYNEKTVSFIKDCAPHLLETLR